MARHIPEEELDAIVSAVERLKTAASIEEIAAALKIELPRRTLQRRVATLVEQGRLVREGRARASRYHLPERKGRMDKAETTDGIQLVDEVEVSLPLSDEGRVILRAVSGPIQSRQPVGYNREFLDDYRPNHSFYLPESLRHRLHEMGRSVTTAQPAGTYARKIWERLLIDLSWNSSRLEGNTYSLLETERLLKSGEAAEGKDAEESQMILNHKAAIELLVDQAEDIGFNRYTFLNLHALLADNLLADPNSIGALRRVPVGINRSTYHPLEVPQMIEECFNQILDTAANIDDPFEQAFFVTVQLPYLQAFEDVNKRVSRLSANIPLIRDNLSPLSFVDVPVDIYVYGLIGVYELNRVELLRDVFVWAYERSCARYSAVKRSLGEPDQFRLQHRALIKNTISEIVKERNNKRQATAYIRSVANESLTEKVRMRFLEVVETELMSLHEGNIARYKIRPSELNLWLETW